MIAISKTTMRNIFVLFVIALLFQSLSWAAEPFVWRQTPDSAPIIFPRKDNQTKEQALAEYFNKIHQTPSVSELLNQSEIQDLKVNNILPRKAGKFSEIGEARGDRPRFIVVTNELRELYAQPYGKKILNIIKRLEASGADVLVLPVVHDLTLDMKEAREYRAKLIDIFDAQLVMGGADIDPYLYGEKTVYARSVVRRRDVSELKFVRQFIEAKKGMNFGICRGHQMCAVAHHKKLIQDIQIVEGASEVHLNGDHLIKADPESEIFSIFDKDKLLVNSLHHQAVIVPDGDKDYKVIATSFDKRPIVEGIEFRNGKGVTLQFHPELMDNETGVSILKKFISMATKNKRLSNSSISCQKLMKEFL